MNFLISKELKAQLVPLTESPLMHYPIPKYLSEAEEEEEDADVESNPADEDEEEDQEEQTSTDVDSDEDESTNVSTDADDSAEVAPTDPNADVSIYGDLSAERMLNMYKSCCAIYDLLEDAKRTVLILLKRPEFFMAANRISQELDIVIPEIKAVLDSDFNPEKEQVYANIIVKFDAYIRALRIVFADIETQIKSKDD